MGADSVVAIIGEFTLQQSRIFDIGTIKKLTWRTRTANVRLRLPAIRRIFTNRVT